MKKTGALTFSSISEGVPRTPQNAQEGAPELEEAPTERSDVPQGGPRTGHFTCILRGFPQGDQNTLQNTRK